MAVVTIGKLDHSRGVILRGDSSPAFRYDPAFDSYLLLKENGCDNHTLTLVLKIFLNQISTFGLPIFPQLDADKQLYLVRPWDAGSWSAFTKLFSQRCTVWNNRFWLIPPKGFSLLDIKVGARKLRPNIYCHLYVDIVGSGGGAHRVIDVANLDKSSTAKKLGVAEKDLNSGSFRSHEGLYDSLDVNGRTNHSVDNKGQWHKHPNYQTIAHEIGHALGLDHIGVSHGDPLCRAAIVADAAFPDGSWLRPLVPALWVGGSNSSVCYGQQAIPSRAANIMGSGSSFDKTNAKPWLQRIAFHTSTKADQWSVSMKRVAPVAI